MALGNQKMTKTHSLRSRRLQCKILEELTVVPKDLEARLQLQKHLSSRGGGLQNISESKMCSEIIFYYRWVLSQDLGTD